MLPNYFLTGFGAGAAGLAGTTGALLIGIIFPP
jgi:hypothetical protein